MFTKEHEVNIFIELAKCNLYEKHKIFYLEEVQLEELVINIKIIVILDAFKKQEVLSLINLLT